MQGHSLLNARFVNDERTTILAEWINDSDETVIHNQYMEAKDNNRQYEELLKHTNLDDIYEYTVNYEREYRKGYEKYVMELAEKEGLISTDKDFTTKQSQEQFIKIFFSKEDDKYSKERLFLLKLTLFETVEEIKNSKKRKLKSDLRKADNILDVLKAAIEIYQSE